jgi:hypothetical protein
MRKPEEMHRLEAIGVEGNNIKLDHQETGCGNGLDL